MIKSGKCRKLISAALSVIAALSLLCVSVGAALGAAGTLGSETPYLEASYVDENGNVADGTALEPGAYTMTFTMYGMKAISEFQVTVDYDPSVVTFADYSNLLSSSYDFDATSSPIIRDTQLIFGFMSRNFDSCTEIDADGTALFSIQINISAASAVNIDKDVMSLDPSPHHTYFEADYGDIRNLEDDPLVLVYDCYALSEDSTFLGTVHPMTADLTPEVKNTSSYSVTAYIGGLASPQDEYGTYAVEGAVVTVGDLTAVTDKNGMFTLEGLESDTYTATVTYAYGFERTFKIIVNDADVMSDTMVGIVHCNLNGDPYISGADYAIYAQYVGMSTSYPDFPEFVNLNKDPYISGADYAIYAAFVGVGATSMTYADTVISN